MSKRIEIQDETETATTDIKDASEEIDTTENLPDNDTDTTPEKELAEQITLARQEAQEHYDRLLRVSADFENYKKRTAREMQEVVKYANERLIKELLTVVDNLERAIESATNNYGPDDPLVHGVHLTLSETLKLLEKHHVAPIASLGKPFDPNFHQAMMQEEVDNQPPNTVVKELQKGYLIHDRLLRPALVAVSKAGGTQPENTD